MVFIETPIFTEDVTTLLTDEEYNKLQQILVGRPDAGVLIRGGGGIRKIRVGRAGRGKSGGARAIYYWATSHDQIYMLMIYTHREMDNLSEHHKRFLKRLVEEEFA